jgi:RNA polymerase sigma-70 factor (ECF subfamily)
MRTWLYRIVTNLCYNRLPNLRRSLNELGDDAIAEIPETAATFGDPAHGVESREWRSYLYQAIDGLDEHYRLLISLRYQNELSYEEIATMLNLPLGTVKTGLFRAKEQLRRALEVYQEPTWTVP